MDEKQAFYIRYSAIALAITGFIYLAGLLMRGIFVNPAEDPHRFAEFVSNPVSIIAAVSYILAMIIHLFGLFLLFLALSESSGRLVNWGLGLSVTGLMVTCAIMGPFIYTYPAIGLLYLEGKTGVMEIVINSAGPFFILSVLIEGLLVSVGAVLFAFCLKSQANIPKWVWMTFAVAPFMFTTPVPGFFIECLGSALLLISALGLLNSKKISNQ